MVRIDGRARVTLGSDVAPAGDVDGDGRPDLVIALPGERAVIVRGGAPAGTTIDLARPPAGGTIELRGLDAGRPRRPAETGAEAAAFAAAGDVDGDGRGELLVGLPAAEPLRGRGRVLVVRGAAGPVVEAETLAHRPHRRARGHPGSVGASPRCPTPTATAAPNG